MEEIERGLPIADGVNGVQEFCVPEIFFEETTIAGIRLD